MTSIDANDAAEAALCVDRALRSHPPSRARYGQAERTEDSLKRVLWTPGMPSEPEAKTLHERAREVFGYRGQITALGEEAAELAAACLRYLIDKGDETAIIEEAVGVQNVLGSIDNELGSHAEWADMWASQEAKLEKALDKRTSNAG